MAGGFDPIALLQLRSLAAGAMGKTSFRRKLAQRLRDIADDCQRTDSRFCFPIRLGYIGRLRAWVYLVLPLVPNPGTILVENEHTMNDLVTFRERVLEFWKWFPTVAETLADALKEDNPSEGLAQFADEVQEKIGGLSWVFGPGESDDRVSFTVTGEGQKARQLLSHFWLSQASEVPGWDFYCARQPSSADQLVDLAIEVAGSNVDAETLMVATEVDYDNRVVNIKAWHKAFESIEQEGRFQILYLLLDEALGEYGTQTKLGEIEFASDRGAKPLGTLPAFLETLWLEQGWEELSPLETYSGYRSEPSTGFERADTIAGYTCVPQVVLGFLNNGGLLEENPLEATGAEFLFVTISSGGAESQEDPLQFRTAIEEEIARRLMGGGYVIGGASGTEHSYVDLVIFDGRRSLAAIREALSEMQLDGEYEIKPFAA